MHTRILQIFNVVAFATIAAFTVPVSAWSQGSNWSSNTPHMTTHGNPPSVTSFGFGGHPGFHGLPASVTSPNFNGTPFHFQQPFHQRPIFAPHRHRDRLTQPFFGNVIAVPYAYPVYVDSPGVDDSMEQEDYRGGPTVFDRRGSGTEEYVQTERGAPSRYEQNHGQDDYRTAAPAEPAPQVEVATQPKTVLIFKDGRQREILNYAIVGSTLFDLSDGLARKVALAELDLPATVKQNDDRGVAFQLPAAKSN
jgi:hypothetical protein